MWNQQKGLAGTPFIRFLRLCSPESLVRRVVCRVGGGLRCGRLSCDCSSAARTLAASRSATTAAARFGLLLLSGVSLSEMFGRVLLTARLSSLSTSERIGRLLFGGLNFIAGTSSSLSDTIALPRFAGREHRIVGLHRGAREHLVFQRLHGVQAPPFASTRQIIFFSTQHLQDGLCVLSVASPRFLTLPYTLISVSAPTPPFPLSASFTPAGSLPCPFLFS